VDVPAFGDSELLERFDELPVDDRPDVLATVRTDVDELTHLMNELVELVTDRSSDEPGIAPSEQDRVFERFYRADAARSVPGSGLGLAIVGQIVERHGGSVWARNGSDGGARVGFSLADE
jgi:signal transduction histidine kinase